MNPEFPTRIEPSGQTAENQSRASHRPPKRDMRGRPRREHGCPKAECQDQCDDKIFHFFGFHWFAGIAPCPGSIRSRSSHWDAGCGFVCCLSASPEAFSCMARWLSIIIDGSNPAGKAGVLHLRLPFHSYGGSNPDAGRTEMRKPCASDVWHGCVWNRHDGTCWSGRLPQAVEAKSRPGRNQRGKPGRWCWKLGFRFGMRASRIGLLAHRVVGAFALAEGRS